MALTDFPLEGSIGVNLRPKRYDVEIYQGDSFDIALRCLDGSGAAVDLTGVTAKVKFVGVNSTPTPATQPTVTVTAASGIIRINLDDTSTLNSPGEYAWDVQLVQGTKKRTYLGGSLTVTKDLTPDA